VQAKKNKLRCTNGNISPPPKIEAVASKLVIVAKPTAFHTGADKKFTKFTKQEHLCK